MKISFNEEKHEYKVDGKAVPCVSDIMQVATCLYYTKDIPQEILDLACRKGSAVHNAIEEYLLFDEYTIEDRYKAIFSNFIKWYDEFHPEVLKVEYKMSNGQFAGTCDLICKINGKIIGIDHKTSNEIHTNMIAIQEAAYDELSDIKIDEWYVLHLTKEKYEFKKIEIRKDIWDKCKDIYFYMKGNNNE